MADILTTEKKKELDLTGSVTGSGLSTDNLLNSETVNPVVYPEPIQEEISPIQQKVEATKKKTTLQDFRTPTEQLDDQISNLKTTLGSVTDNKTRLLLNNQLRTLNLQRNQIGDITSGGAQRVQQEQIQSVLEAQKRRREEIQTGVGEAGQRVKSQTSAVQSKFLTSPEGVSKSGGQQISGLIEKAGEQSLSQAMSSDPELSNIRNTIQNLQTGATNIETVKESIKEGEFKALSKFFTDVEKQEKEAQKDAYSTLKDFPPEVIANFGTEGIQAFFKSKGSSIDSFTAGGIADGYKKIMEDKSIDEEERVLKLEEMALDIDEKSTSEAKKLINQSSQLDNAVMEGLISKEAASAIKQKLGIEVEQLSPTEQKIKDLDASILATKDEAERLKLIEQKSELEDQVSIYGKGNTVVDKLSKVVVGETMKRPAGRDVKYEGQCAAFVNDIYGLPAGFFGSELEQKTNRINKYANPVAGDAFISDLSSSGGYGHVGFIESVNDDGTYTIVDSNRYNGDGKVNRRIKTADQLFSKTGESVVGFYSPVNDAKNVKNNIPENIKAQIQSFVQTKVGIKDKDARLQAEKNILKEIVSGRANTPEEAKMNLGLYTERDGVREKRILNEIKTPRDDTAEIMRNVKNISELANLTGGIGDTAAITAFLKTIDPGSVARESEVAGVENARGLIDNVKTWFVKLGTGARLSENQRTQLKEVSTVLGKLANEKMYELLITRKEELKNNGIDPSVSISDYEINKIERELGEESVNKIKTENNIKQSESDLIGEDDPFGLKLEEVAVKQLDYKNLGRIQNEISKSINKGENVMQLKQELLDDGFDPNQFSWDGSI